MRIVAEIPHSIFKITIFSWNAKFIIKIELDSFEQIFKVKEEDVSSVDDIVKMIDQEFLERTLVCFVEMRSSFVQAYKKINPF